jgi:hypothetical protein
MPRSLNAKLKHCPFISLGSATTQTTSMPIASASLWHCRMAHKVLRNNAVITETNRKNLVLDGMQNRTLDPYLEANNRVLISVMGGLPPQSPMGML